MDLIFHDLLVIILEIYIDDVVVKLDNMDSHLADLRLALESASVCVKNKFAKICV
jgi:hypothetical protein